VNSSEVTVVRLYLSEGRSHLERLLRRLREEELVRGVTVFRGIAGFGESGALHTSHRVDLSLDLPVVVEFFDRPERVEEVLDRLAGDIKPGHLVRWTAHCNEA